MKEFGVRMHYSVFRCDLSKMDLVRLKSRLSDVIKHDEDRVMIINLGPVENNPRPNLIFLGVRPDEEPLTDAIF